MKKRLISLLLAAVTVFGVLPRMIPAADAKTTITSPDQISGSEFTGNRELAGKLDAIFAGNASIYSNSKCTKLVNAALGTYSVPNNGVYQYVGAYGESALNTGTSCWIYANGVYYTLFGEALGNGSPGPNSEKIDLSTTSTKKLTYANMRSWGVRDDVGAQIRVGNHSIVVLDYDDTYLTYVDGNGDGKGLVAVRKWTWSEVKNSSSIGGTVKYIVQPKDSYLRQTYPGFSNEYVKNCESYPSYGQVTVADGCWAYSLPCTDAVAKEYGCTSQALTEKQLAAGDTVTIHGILRNTQGEYWYMVTLADGTDNVYISSRDAGAMTQLWPWVEGSILPDSISGTTLLSGTVKAGGCRIESVQAFVYPGKTLTADAVIQSKKETVSITDSYTLKSSVVDNSLTFRKLEAYGDGKYTIAIRATVTNYLLDLEFQQVKPVTQESMVVGSDRFSYDADSGCSHSYKTSVTPPACETEGYTTHTCSVCGYSYESDYTAPAGHTAGEAVAENQGADGAYDLVVYCVDCGAELSRERQEGYLPGDINGDGEANNKDLTRLFQYLSDWDAEVQEIALDINGDGSVDNKDLTRLFQYLSGWDVEIY